MQSKHLKLTVLAALLLIGIGPAIAANSGQTTKQHMEHGMMAGGSMEACRSMMGGGMMGGMMGGAMMPTLPPGNAKLQLQMQAEMMQKMGEIAAKYADKIKERSPQ